MSDMYINFYNNLIKLTTSKFLYKGIVNKQDSFGDRLTIFLIHFAFILKEFKNPKNEKKLQELYDFNFRQLELSIREIGYGDQSINKKMKDYLNLFYGMIDKIDNWENLSLDLKHSLLMKFLNNNADKAFLTDYFEKYRLHLLNNTLNSHIKGVIKP
jgi:cytochrome b pre-mRNA-processing protein 3